MSRRSFVFALLAGCVAIVGVTSAYARDWEYNRDIRPILAENCFACHGPDSAARQADLRLDQREAAVDFEAIVPGSPDKSSIVERILSDDPDVVMPPPASHKTLTQREKEILKQWIATGAEYQPHWSFIAPQRQPIPNVEDGEWIRNPIDAFVLARLETERLAPAPEADRRTLVRRVSLDLTGLPPSPSLVEDFVNDPAPNAYERLVDRLLDSKAWGEHRARYWLDAARYADTHGIHFDNFREVWAYRNWVIDAFNRNMSFDQFTIEQLAGDLLPEPTLDQRIATGFNRCNITTSEGGIIDEEYLVLYTRDRTETTSTVWMGLTAGCAVCHDHKYDPLSQREFYELAAFFNNTTQAAKDGNVHNTPPIVTVPTLEDRPRWFALEDEIADASQAVQARRSSARPDFDQWLAAGDFEPIDRRIPSDNLRFHLPLDAQAPTDQSPESEQTDETAEKTSEAADVATTEAIVDGERRELTVPAELGWEPGHVGRYALRTDRAARFSIPEIGDFEKDQPFSCSAWVNLRPDALSGAIVARMDESDAFRGWDLWIEGGRIGSHLIHRWNEDAVKVVCNNPIQADKWHHVVMTYDGSGKAAGLKFYIDGAEQPARAQADTLKNSIRTDKVPLTIGQRSASSQLHGLMIQDVRIYDKTLSATETASLFRSVRVGWLAEKPGDARIAAETNELFDWWLHELDPKFRDALSRENALTHEREAIKTRGTIAHVMHERAEPPKAYVLDRGEYDRRGEEVAPGTPEMLPEFPSHLPRNRLGLAQWLLAPEHPLTSRVIVNGFWQQTFGRGIVETAGDFGISGTLPTHPELLDWMAVEFRESGWDVKRFFKLLVTSAAYRQSAVSTPKKRHDDPDNALLSRGPRFRLDAEAIRDYALAVSGLLSDKIGGPSVRPYQPEGVWEAVAMPGSNTRDYKRDEGENLYRRSLYTFWKRSAPPASLDIFNAPNRESCVVVRERTNTPLQALATLNDPQFVEAARNLAENVLRSDAKTNEDRVQAIAVRLLARPFDDDEIGIVTQTLEKLRSHYSRSDDDARRLIAVGESVADSSLPAAELAAWTMLANQLMNLDEVLCK